jgi:SAM-dependent methyltransferase
VVGGRLGLVPPALMGLAAFAGTSWSSAVSLDPRLRLILLAPVALWAFSISRRRWRFAVALACCFIGGEIGRDRQRVLLQERSFFGVYRVDRDAGDESRTLWHGTTLHGEQRVAATGHSGPLTYYHPTGPIGRALNALLPDRPQARVAAVGLGAGSLAAYARPGQEWTFYEIDPRIEAIARNPSFFTYLSECAGRCRVVLGDARLSLTRDHHERFDVIVLDAFSSDAIPVHLLTREALDLYLSRLAPGGVLAFHISNRHLSLRPVLDSLFADRGLAGLSEIHAVAPLDPAGRSSSEWVVAARNPAGLARLASDPRWTPMAGRTADRVWTDQYSDVVSVLSLIH